MATSETFAVALIEAHQSGRRADALALVSPDYAEALDIQNRVQAHLGPVAGFKVARRPDGPPILAPIPADLTFETGASVPVRDMLGIELEIGFELLSDPGADLMARPQDHFRPRVLLELVDSRLSGAQDDPMMKLADMQINAGMVLGPAAAQWDGADFGTVRASLQCGDRRVIEGMVQVPGGSALDNLGLAVAHLGAHCGGLQTGQVVITGSISGLIYFPAGTDVRGHIHGLGEVSCQLE